MRQIRLLIVDDEDEPRNLVRKIYEEVLSDFGLGVPAITTMGNAKAAKAHALQFLDDPDEPYDIASLDLNLGDVEVTGLDILEALKLSQAAWTAVLLTGFEMDLEKAAKTFVEPKKLTQLLRSFRSEAQEKFWPMRVLVIGKPHHSLPHNEQARLLRTHIEQVAEFYRNLESQRYMFKRLEVPRKRKVKHKSKYGKRKTALADTIQPRAVYQIRCGCGDMVELDEESWPGLKTMHELFKMGRNAVITAEQAMQIEPYKPRNNKLKPTKAIVKPREAAKDYFIGEHPGWDSYDGATRLQLIEEAISPWIDAYCELRKYQDTGSGLNKAQQAKLDQMLTHPLSQVAEDWYDNTKELTGTSGSLAEITIGRAAQELVNPVRQRPQEAREDVWLAQRKSRLCAALRDKNILSFADYIEENVSGTDRNWTHSPPKGIDWST